MIDKLLQIGTDVHVHADRVVSVELTRGGDTRVVLDTAGGLPWIVIVRTRMDVVVRVLNGVSNGHDTLGAFVRSDVHDFHRRTET